MAEGGLGIKNVGSNGGMGVGNWEGRWSKNWENEHLRKK